MKIMSMTRNRPYRELSDTNKIDLTWSIQVSNQEVTKDIKRIIDHRKFFQVIFSPHLHNTINIIMRIKITGMILKKSKERKSRRNKNQHKRKDLTRQTSLIGKSSKLCKLIPIKKPHRSNLKKGSEILAWIISSKNRVLKMTLLVNLVCLLTSHIRDLFSSNLLVISMRKKSSDR